MNNLISFKIVRLAGLSVIIIYLIMTAVFISTLDNKQTKNPILKFEFAKTRADIEAFTPKDLTQRQNLFKALDNLNRLDFLFAFSYTFFLSMFFVKIKFYTNKNYFLIPLGFVAFAMVYDFLENFQLLDITGSYPEDIDASLTLLHIFTWIKWISLTIVSVFGFLFFYIYKKTKIFAFFTILPVITLILTFFIRNFNEVFAMTVILSIVSMIIFSFFAEKLIQDKKQ